MNRCSRCEKQFELSTGFNLLDMHTDPAFNHAHLHFYCGIECLHADVNAYVDAVKSGEIASREELIKIREDAEK